MTLRLLIGLLLAALAATPAQSQTTTAARVTNFGLPATTVGVNVNYGWEFTPATDIIVTELGIVDVGGNGLLESHALRLYDATSTLIVTGVPAGTAAPLIDGSRWGTANRPARLDGGVTYLVSTNFPSGSTEQLYFENADGTTVSYAAGISPGRGLFGQSAFVAVTRPTSQIAFRPHGPNFRYTALPANPVFDWPTGPAPCNNINSLQACLNILQAGDQLRIATNTAPAQVASIAGPAANRLNLTNAPGFTPVFDSLELVVDPGTPSATPTNILISGLAANGTGRLRVVRAAPTTYPGGVVIQNNDVPGIEVTNVRTEQLTVLENRLRIPVGGAPYGVYVQDAAALAEITGNEVQHDGGGQPQGIVVNQTTGSAKVDIQGNHIHGAGFNGGIGTYAGPVATLHSRIANNVVTGVDSPDNGWGISASLANGDNGSTYVVNNSVAYGANGILLADFSGRARNNIVAFHSGVGLRLDNVADPVAGSEASNLYFGNGTAYQFLQPVGRLPVDPLFADPRFADPVLLSLAADSPARNSGSVPYFGSDFTGPLSLDFDNSPRVQWRIDRGAWEQGTALTDQDLDTVADSLDNCMTYANTTQTDTDADQYGNRCDGDYNQSNSVNAADLSIFRAAFGSTNANVDLNGIGAVNAADLAIFRNLFGKPPGPSGPVLGPSCTPGAAGCGWSTGDMETFSQTDLGDGTSEAGSMLSANFSSLFGSSIEIGGTFIAAFTTASAVFAYLPATGAAAALNGTVVNPMTTSSGELGGEVLALELNAAISAADLVVSDVDLGSLRFCNFTDVPALNGQTVDQFLGTANHILGGDSGPFGASTAAAVARRVNQAFVNGAPSTFAQASLVAGACPST